MKRLDPRLRYLIRHSTDDSTGMVERVSSALCEPIFEDVEVLVQCADHRAVERLREAGMLVRFIIEGPTIIVTGAAPLSICERLSELEGILRIESSRPMTSDLDISVSECGVEKVRSNGHDIRGSGIIVGIADGGIDYTHPDFCNRDGSSRILYLWDQFDEVETHGNVLYGREYTKTEIDEALRHNIPIARIDRTGHGTHVAGIAAGNGLASKGAYTGIAPEADLIVVAISREKGATLGRSVRAAEAVAYIVRQANGQPVAVNISLGMNGGGHCGETLVERGIDNLARQPNVVIVKSAGNEGGWNTHTGGQIQPGEIKALEFVVQTNYRQDDVMELWYDGEDSISVALQPPGSSSSPVSFIGPEDEQDFDTLAGNNFSIDSDMDGYDTGDTLTTIVLSRGDAPFIQPGTWKLLLRGDAIKAGRYDIWIERAPRTRPGEQTKFSLAFADQTRTISVPGTSRQVITVGSYVSRPDDVLSLTKGQVSSFSSQGPTRYGVMKPEIAAPGQAIISACAFKSNAEANPNKWYTVMSGTSMAAPHVTGAAALILSVRRGLTCEQVKQILMKTARRNGLAKSAPDNVWGSGRMDVEAAIALARDIRFPVISHITLSGAVLSWKTDIPATGAVRFHSHKQHLQFGKNALSRVRLELATEHKITIGDAPSGLYFCEILAFTEDNWSASDDNAGDFYTVTVP